MSLEIKGRPCDFCPKECRFMSLSVDSVPMYANNETQMILNTVHCENEDVCKMWAAREDVHRTCKGCTYDNADCTNPEPCVVNEFGSRTGYTRKETKAEWFVMSSQDLDSFQTKVTAKCSSCGYVHNVTNIDEKTRMLTQRHNSRLGIIDPNELEVLLPTVCPGCHSRMIFNK